MSSREIIHLHLGQAGARLGGSVWNAYCDEYRVDRGGQYWGSNPKHVSHIFKTNSESFHTPRALFMDLDPEVKNTFQNTSLKGLFSDEQFITGREDAASNYGRGFNLGREIRDEMIEAVRREAEDCDSLQGFYLFRSLGGGTGSGLGSMLVQELQREFGGKDKINFNIVPSPVLNTSVTEPYNVVHAMFADIEDSDISVLMDNKALYSINQNQLDIEVPCYSDLNKSISRVVQGITSTLGVGAGSNRMSLSELKTNLIPFNRIHHTMPSYAPLTSKSRSYYHKMGVTNLTRAVFDKDNMYLSVGDTKESKILSSCLLYRGDVSRREANQAKNAILDEYEFVDWAPNGIKLNIQNKGSGRNPGGHSKSVAMLGINTALKDNLGTMNKRFDMMLQKRAFIHWYQMEGMEEIEFHDAKYELLALERDYKELHYEDNSKHPINTQGDVSINEY